MRSLRLLPLIALLTLLSTFVGVAPGRAQPGCQFTLGFKALHDLIPQVVGDCVSDEAHNPANGDALQQTTGGLLVWRKADNWTAFTDGTTTWLLGPNGLQSRPNDQRFPWEAGAAPQAGQSAAARGERAVLALYYPWFDPDSFGRAPDQPAQQPYQSDDPALIAQQVEQAQGAGIDGFVSAWLGQGDRTDRNFATLLVAAQQRGFHATIYFETDHFLPFGPRDVAEQLGNFYRAYLDHPALVRYQGKPVIFFWRTSALDLDTWASIRAQVDPGHRAIWIAEGDQFGQLAGDTFDGIHPYSTAWSGNPAATLKSFGARAHAYPGKLWVPSAMPGYDDTRLGNGGFAVDRRGGDYYRQSFEGAIASGPDWAILITSWNEWLEGHQIEPATGYGSLYLDITREEAARFKGS